MGKIPYKVKLDIIFLDFAKLLNKKGLINDNVTLKEIMEVVDELIETPGFSHFVHDFICDECQSSGNSGQLKE